MTDREALVNKLVIQFEAVKRKLIQSHPTSDILPDKMPTPAQTRVLMIVDEHKSLSVKEISILLNVTSSAATQLIDQLVQDAFLIRRENPLDRRQFMIELSPGTEKMINKFKQFIHNQFSDMTENLSNQEIEHLTNLLKKIKGI